MREAVIVFRGNYRNLTTIFVTLIIAGQSWAIVDGLDGPDHVHDYYQFVAPYLWTCDPLEIPERDGKPTRNPFAWWLKCASYNIFENHKILVIPFSIAIMPLTYWLATQLTRDRLIGLFALIALTFNPLYTDWAGNATYDQVWSFFLLFSVWILSRSHTAGLGSIALSVAAKSMTALFFPLWLYMARKDKHIVVLGVCAAMVSVFYIMFSGFPFVGNEVGFFPERAEDALFINISVLWQVLPILLLFVGLNRYFVAKQKPENQKIVGLWVLAFLLMAPLVMLFTLQDMYSYRYVPLAVFMSIFIGQTLVQVGNWIVETMESRRLKTLKNINP